MIQFPGSAFPDGLMHCNSRDFEHFNYIFANTGAPFTGAPFTGARSKLNICVIRIRTGPPPTNNKMVNSSEKSFELSDLIKILRHFNLWMIEFHDRLNL